MILLEKRSLILVIISILFSGFLSTADGQPRTLDYHFGSFLYGSSTGSDLPFWFHSNADGKVDPESINFLNEIGFQSEIYNINQFRLSAGANLVVRISEGNSLHFSELFASAEFKGYRLSAGKFIQQIGLNNHELSVGSMMVSRNASPIPKVSIWTPDFLDVPFTKGYVQYKGLFSHGWFRGNRYVDDAYLHQKYLYLRVNLGSFSATGGAIHNSMWGGNHPGFGRLPQSFSDYIRIIFGLPAEEGPGVDIVNALGNSVAAYEFGAEYRFKGILASVTRLFYLEDRVSTRFRSPWDGVWGLNIYFDNPIKWLHGLTYEHINTKKQDSRSFQALGRADYYNNILYENGWSFHGRVIGIPLILYDQNAQQGMAVNNMIVGHHIGINGHIAANTSYTFFFTYSRNYGRNGTKRPRDGFPLAPLRTDQYSLYLAFAHNLRSLKNLSIILGIGGDFGELYEDAVGLTVGVKWNGSLKR